MLWKEEGHQIVLMLNQPDEFEEESIFGLNLK